MSQLKSIRDVWKFLDSIPMFANQGKSAANFSLDKITAFCADLGDPQNSFPSIHVAGTNGKGSVCAILEAIYREAGYITGVFTSPHLERYNERFKINGKEIDDNEILRFFKKAKPLIEKHELTYFEISTALAFWAFDKAEVDIAIIETGLGGRLDATNIIKPELSIITSIGLDHTDILGGSLPEIAKEKAGIIKKEIPVVIGNIEGEELSLIEKKATEEYALLVKAGDIQPVWRERNIMLKGWGRFISTQFYEPVNMWNVATSITAVRALSEKFPVDRSAEIRSIEQFRGVPARFEKLNPLKEWYFSGSHNLVAINSMLEAATELNTEKVHFVLSFMKDKAQPEVLAKFKALEPCYYYEIDSERAASAADIQPHLAVKTVDEKSIKNLLHELNDEVVIFTGSFYFYSIVKRWLTHLNYSDFSTII
ncbi:MAG: bifunctional folylpolyglutamate synthase/dihydrofolate synthase [Balneolaceae bacterium]|nr:bifunctional folylpolyglutamate synthase/dihydrofolate synthase [Balneolaceae bacterium]